MKQLFHEPKYYRILLLAFSSNGTNRREIKEFFGIPAEISLDELINTKVITEDQFGNITGNQEILSLSTKTLRSLIQSCVTDCTSEVHEGSLNSIGFYSESLNREAVVKIQNLMADLDFEIRKVISDPSSKGDIHMFTAYCNDLVTPIRRKGGES